MSYETLLEILSLLPFLNQEVGQKYIWGFIMTENSRIAVV